jgi:hypothetical protein
MALTYTKYRTCVVACPAYTKSNHLPSCVKDYIAWYVGVGFCLYTFLTRVNQNIKKDRKDVTGRFLTLLGMLYLS